MDVLQGENHTFAYFDSAKYFDLALCGIRILSSTAFFVYALLPSLFVMRGHIHTCQPKSDEWIYSFKIFCIYWRPINGFTCHNLNVEYCFMVAQVDSLVACV